MLGLLQTAQGWLNKTREIDFLAPLLLRLYLIPVFWMAGTQKLAHFDSTVEWFGNPDWGLGLPVPWLMAALAVGAELGGAILYTLGLATRWISLPLMFTMIVAAVTSHAENGWLAISAGDGVFATERTMEAIERLTAVRSILMEHGNYEWLTEHGSIVVLNNGIEFAATYFIMILALFFYGGGRYISLDYWIDRKFGQK
ncbi:Inner membrane protein YphA [BD1-7 clade bacterium]|uniref:Inner membrane protein YphA n=1 Tax=BD1-7 clade bacterium TaxID=2029982 RepID=A0A5S9P684_9GAMM|nr:Inner membrane protein YphA [BD1-7 clade bacterium]CAA0099010.1 Inner membrane protein YphA [BD1-7 clade bacterium]